MYNVAACGGDRDGVSACQCEGRSEMLESSLDPRTLVIDDSG